MNTLETADRRQFTRIAFNSPVHLTGHNGVWTSELLDISLKGVLVAKPSNWKGTVADEFFLKLVLHQGDIEISMDVEVAHIETDKVGFRCKQIDLESISHLRRLIELNLGDYEILHRELSSLGIS